ncbi:MAG: HAD-IIA family hydrolase [Oscillospiraceae bacterium]|jgi:HAD superfamily hydrolase (TIGR01450 family)|nr:HAD-IIA family hydrolase [Oscillospiraceae bacterium]
MRHPLFQTTKYLILDMDGTVCLGQRMLPGAGEFVQSLRARGIGRLFFSNNSSRSVDQCVRALRAMGFPAAPEDIAISTHVAADYLNERHPGARVFLLGNEHLSAELRQLGLRLVSDKPDLILLGFDTTLDYEKITKAANWLAAGLPYYATHPDVNCPVAGGFLPDTGAMIELFAASAGRRPVVLGKPERPTVDYLCRRLACAPQELCFVGDRLETDIAIGRHGVATALVFTGVTSPAQYEAQGECRAGLAVESLAALSGYL